MNLIILITYFAVKTSFFGSKNQSSIFLLFLSLFVNLSIYNWDYFSESVNNIELIVLIARLSSSCVWLAKQSGLRPWPRLRSAASGQMMMVHDAASPASVALP